MTRGSQSTRPEALKKNYNIQVREQQRSQGAEFRRSDIPRLFLEPRYLQRRKHDKEGRNPARRHGNQWRAEWFICGKDVEDGGIHEDYICDCAFDDWGIPPESATRRMVVSIMDIARPAKAKGIAKEFEIVDSVPRVIALEESDIESIFDYDFWDDEEWEKIGVKQEKTYSAALREDNR